jgi:hypothetical protein
MGDNIQGNLFLNKLIRPAFPPRDLPRRSNRRHAPHDDLAFSLSGCASANVRPSEAHPMEIGSIKNQPMS